MSRVCIAVIAYFALWALPRFAASVGGGALVHALAASLPMVLGALAVAGLWGIAGLLRSRLASTPVVPFHKGLGIVAGVGFAAFTVALAAPRPLPSGSWLEKFDAVAWQAEGAALGAPGEDAPRQRMLGDLVDNVLPGRSRAELEALLGPSEETGCLADTGRDLIYRLGMERGSFFRVDSEWLLVWLDESGHYQRCRVAND